MIEFEIDILTCPTKNLIKFYNLLQDYGIHNNAANGSWSVITKIAEELTQRSQKQWNIPDEILELMRTKEANDYTSVDNIINHSGFGDYCSVGNYYGCTGKTIGISINNGPKRYNVYCIHENDGGMVRSFDTNNSKTAVKKWRAYVRKFTHAQ